ncbi:MAG TPA: energy transducer TonB [Candidatus Acidoferrales bacterium]|nr:energy transducer TonB [Candidatus Acidoferrales bacterium]
MPFCTRYGRARAKVFLVASLLLGALILMPDPGHARPANHGLQNPSRVAPPISLAAPDLDSLAKKMAEEIDKKKPDSVVVVGGGGPEAKVSDLGAKLRDAFNDSLVLQARRSRVLEGNVVREMLRQSRVSEGMLYSDEIGAWIADHARADAYVTFRVYALTGLHASLVAEFFTRGKEGFQSIHLEAGSITLTDQQSALADSDFQPESNFPGASPVAPGAGYPRCVVCPNPSYSEEARRLKISGIVLLLIVVRPDGLADDVMVAKPMGHGLDANAIDTVLDWKFQPAKDAQGNLVAVQVPVEVSFKLR